MTIMTLGSDQAAIATLLSAIGTSQAAMTAAEVDLSYREGPIFGITGAVDYLFNALTCPTVIARLTTEDPLHPSALLLNRTNSQSGAACVQVAFNTAAQVGVFIAASNWLTSLANVQLGALEVHATVKANLRRLSGDRFQRSPVPQTAAISGRGVISAATTQKAAGAAVVTGKGRVAVDTVQSGP